MTKKTEEPKTYCSHCGGEVEPIKGKVILGGSPSSFRHKPPFACRKGDPLMDGDVETK
jgi:hypothetical protein